ncbi:MAG: transposase, partial [Mycobacterium sp.]
VQASGKTVGAVAWELDLTETALREWVRQAEIDAGRGQPGALTTDERAELAQLRREVRTLRMERDIPKKSDGLLREGERVRFAFIAAEKPAFPVTVLCRILAVSRAGFYAAQARPVPTRAAARMAFLDYIEIFYNQQRRHSSLGFLSPLAFERQWYQQYRAA